MYKKAVIALSCLALLAGCGGGGGGSSERGIKITPDGAAYFLDGGRVSVGVPKDAVSTSMVVTYSVPSSVPTTNYVPGTAIKFSPATFAQPVSMHIVYDIANLPAGTSEAQLRLGRLEGSTWVEIAGSKATTETHSVDGFVTSFGTFGVIVKPIG
jgi:hypothetical protein